MELNREKVGQVKVLIDNGHGVNTRGKRSPDGRLLEYKWTREIASRLKTKLAAVGIKSELICPEEQDTSLMVRVDRVNKICAESKQCILISIHINAANDGSRWMAASGWSGWVAPNASVKSKNLAKCLYEEAEKLSLKGNRCVPIERYWIGNFAIISKTRCPAVLTENMFQDNRHDVDYLLSEEGKNEIVLLHCNGIINYINNIQQNE